jgi:hypothetical protein
MLVEGTLRWKVTEDCPWDLLVALCLRDLAGLRPVASPSLPAVFPAVERVPAPRVVGGPKPAAGADAAAREELAAEWQRWWRRAAMNAHAQPSWSTQFVPPHFAAFDRELELQDLVIARFVDAGAWATARRAEYLADESRNRDEYVRDIVDVVRTREHELRRQAGSFHLNIETMPLAEPGAWVVGPDTVVVSWSLRDDHEAFRQWLEPLVVALV